MAGSAGLSLSVVEARKNALKRNVDLSYLVDDQELSQVAAPLCIGYHMVATCVHTRTHLPTEEEALG